MHLTLQQMRLFEAVARLGSFTKAANELHLTQPAVSIQVKRLEENAGMPLLQQVGKRIHTTAAGREMYQACRDVLARVNRLDDSLADLKGAVRGPLQLSAVTTAKYFMPRLLGTFLQRYPEVEPRLNVTNRARVIERLERNEDDLVIMGQVPEHLKVEAFPFLDNPLVVAAHPEHPLADEKGITIERLVEERFLSREPGSGTRNATSRLFAAHGVECVPYMELGSSEAIKQAVMAGLGITVLSLHNIQLELETGKLIVLDVEEFPLMRRWYAVHLEGKELFKVARTYLDFLLTEGPSSLDEWMRDETESLKTQLSGNR